ncbi:cell division protein FtsN [Rossellomorea vietnamensis]|uniref:Cell division protein FtsN n=1 Tax=Rossellomorea vietnamensis TaxID=218284 RepID=A0A5D4M7Z9_9BACI|nr:TasA family protein [Rossellomorea vietnamensis]TYR97726.1 cell division protein FtsN [Rossellomorea vietnamensis]
MGIKQKLGLGVASAALGLSLIGGGTYAYFNDVETSTNTFAAGTLDLTVDPTDIFDVSNIKPGDYMYRTFDLVNSGTLDIKEVTLDTTYTVTDAKGDNAGEDFGKYIKVEFLKNLGDEGFFGDSYDDYTVIGSKTLAELKGRTIDDLAKEYEGLFKREVDGISAGHTDNMSVRISFVDNNQDQNKFQGDSLELKWKFTAEQENGEHISND